MPGGRKILFELALSKLLQVTGPWAKGLRVLEAADVTADHIYYVFLGIMSQLDDDFQKNEFTLNSNTIEDIRRIANKRHQENNTLLFWTFWTFKSTKRQKSPKSPRLFRVDSSFESRHLF